MLQAETIIRPHIRNMPAYEPVLPFEVRSQQLGIAPKDLCKLDANENPYGTLPEVAQTLTSLPYAHIYPDPESRKLRQTLAAYYNVPVENLLAGAGADELIDLIMRLFLEPGDAIINCPPTFGMYTFDADIANARVIDAPRRRDFSLDTDAIERAVERERPKLLFIASPNNPDGSVTPGEVLNRLLDLPLVVVLDQAYVEFAEPGSSYLQQVPQRENLIVLRTFSKWAGLAGMRVGFGAFPSNLMPHLWKVKQPYNVTVAAEAAAVVSVENAAKLEEIGKRIIAERERLFAALDEISWLEPYPSQSNFILCRVLPTGRCANAVELEEQLAQTGILIRYFRKPGLEDHVRISVGKPEQTDVLLKRLTELE
jgi:histidinol-phosphate aminotransferase